MDLIGRMERGQETIDECKREFETLKHVFEDMDKKLDAAESTKKNQG